MHIEEAMRLVVRHENTIRIIIKWLEENQPDVFKRGLWDVLTNSNLTTKGT